MLNWRSVDGGKIETVDLMQWIASPDATTRRTKLHFKPNFPGESLRLGWGILLTRPGFRQRVSMPVVGMPWMKMA